MSHVLYFLASILNFKVSSHLCCPSKQFIDALLVSIGKCLLTVLQFTFLTSDIDFTVKFKLNHITWTGELLDNSSNRYQNLSKELKTAVSTYSYRVLCVDWLVNFTEDFII